MSGDAGVGGGEVALDRSVRPPRLHHATWCTSVPSRERRHPTAPNVSAINESDPRICGAFVSGGSTCEQCGASLLRPAPGSGRRIIFCSAACRQKAYRARGGQQSAATGAQRTPRRTQPDHRAHEQAHSLANWLCCDRRRYPPFVARAGRRGPGLLALGRPRPERQLGGGGVHQPTPAGGATGRNVDPLDVLDWLGVLDGYSHGSPQRAAAGTRGFVVRQPFPERAGCPVAGSRKRVVRAPPCPVEC